MSRRAARREYLQAVAEFQAAVQEFSAGMSRILDSPARDDERGAVLMRLLGPRKPAKRSPRTEGERSAGSPRRASPGR